MSDTHHILYQYVFCVVGGGVRRGRRSRLKPSPTYYLCSTSRSGMQVAHAKVKTLAPVYIRVFVLNFPSDV